MNSHKQTGIAGLLLVLGTCIFLITVFFEYRIGWIDASSGGDGLIEYVESHWDQLQKIWTWQMIGGISSLLAFIMFLKVSEGWKSVLWSVMVLLYIFSTIAFFLTLGSYGPALGVYDSNPVVFETTRGGIASLYQATMIAPIPYLIIFCMESFSKNGLVSKKVGLVSIAVFVLVLVAGSLSGISIKLSALGFFILYLVLGYSALKKGGNPFTISQNH